MDFSTELQNIVNNTQPILNQMLQDQQSQLSVRARSEEELMNNIGLAVKRR